MLVLYTGLLFTHLFVPLFFVLYLLLRIIIKKNSQNRLFYNNFFLIALVSYFLIQITQARFSLGQLIANVIKSPNIQSFSSIILASTTATSFETNTRCYCAILFQNRNSYSNYCLRCWFYFTTNQEKFEYS